MRNRRVVTRGTSDPKLTPLQEAIESDVRTDPEMATELRAHSIGTREEARKTRGSQNGNSGPRMMMLAGYETPGDGGEGVFYWDATSTTADDEGVTTLAPMDGGVGRWKRAQLYPDPIPQTAAVVGVRVLTSGTTSYTKTAGTRDVIIELWGGGSAAGGANVSGAATVSVGGGGGSGGYLRKRIAGIGAGPFTVAIGAGGTGVSAGQGNAGGDTTFNDGTTTYTAKGSAAGGSASAASGTAIGSTPAPGGVVSTNGDINGAGVPGQPGFVLTSTLGVSGGGGATSLGGAPPSVPFLANGNANGANAVANTGSGGSGAYGNNAAAKTGGNGAAGLIIVTEFS